MLHLLWRPRALLYCILFDSIFFLPLTHAQTRKEMLIICSFPYWHMWHLAEMLSEGWGVDGTVILQLSQWSWWRTTKGNAWFYLTLMTVVYVCIKWPEVGPYLTFIAKGLDILTDGCTSENELAWALFLVLQRGEDILNYGTRLQIVFR